MERIKVHRLLLQMQSGDIDAFEELYNGLFNIVCSLAYSIVLDRQIAEDIAQDTFIMIGNKINEYRPPYNGFSWIYTMTKNTALNMYKKQQREVSSEQIELRNQISESIELDFENREYIQELLMLLPEVERQIVILHLVVNLKHKEIAKILGLPLGTVLSKYNRSIKLLRNFEQRRKTSEKI